MFRVKNPIENIDLPTIRRSSLARVILRAAAAVGILGLALAEDSGNQEHVLNYEQPKMLTGTIYAKDSERRTPLFRFKRIATRSGSKLKVLREYTYPDGRPAVRECVFYHGDQLLSFELHELQIDASGKALIRREAADMARPVIFFEYTAGVASGGKTRTDEERLRPDTVNDDMIVPFLTSHWDALMKGEAVRCRYISVPRRETVGFTFLKESESERQGQEVVIIRMEPTSRIISALIDPVR